MGRLDDFTVDDFHEQLQRTEGNTPTQRVLAAIGRKQGATLGELAEHHNVAEKTIRNWLDRFAEKPLLQAPYDEQRSGRPSKLSGEARDAFLEDLQQSPDELDYDHHAWYSALAHHHLSEEQGVEYSPRHVYRLLHDAGFTYRSACPRHYKADPEDEAQFRNTVQETDLIENGWTFIAVDQSSKYVGTVNRSVWYLAGSEPRRPVWNARSNVTTLAAVTHEGESLYLATEEYLTADHGIALLQALLEEFGERLIVFLDQAPYFYAKDLWEFVSGERLVEYVDDTSVACVRGESLQVWYFSSQLPELNTVEKCWNQFKAWYKYRFFEDLSEVKQTLTSGFASIDEPNILEYFCQ